MKKLTNLILILILLTMVAGCDAMQEAGKSLGLISDTSQNHLDPASTAIVGKKNAANAATAAAAQMTITAATAIAPQFATESAGACTEISDLVKKGDYSKLAPGAKLTGCNFSGVSLFGLNLSKVDLRAANLNRANLSSANLSRADLKFALLTQANLKSAILTQANLVGANLRGADLTGANLSGVDLTAAVVTQEQLALTSSLTGAILPDFNQGKPTKK